jgi:preprotein translocase subunit SecB
MSEENDQPAATGQAQGQFAIQKIYVKDVSFEAPGAPETFTGQWQPSVDVQISNSGRSLNETVHEVVLTLTITVHNQDKTAYLVEVQQAGIFNIVGATQEQLPPLLNVGCSNILFPYAREAVSDLVTRGGFPQLLLAPVNFEALYVQQMQEAKQAQQAAESEDKKKPH